jgi:hypothetical protein
MTMGKQNKLLTTALMATMWPANLALNVCMVQFLCVLWISPDSLVVILVDHGTRNRQYRSVIAKLYGFPLGDAHIYRWRRCVESGYDGLFALTSAVYGVSVTPLANSLEACGGKEAWATRT